MSLMTDKMSSIFLNLDTIYIMQNISNIFDTNTFDKPDLKGKWKLDTNISTKAMYIIFNFVQPQTHL